MRHQSIAIAGLALGLALVMARPALADDAPQPIYHATGAAPISAEEYAALPKLPTFRAWLPRQVDLSAMFPTPGYQSQVPDCSAWATTYAGLGYLHGLELGHRPEAASDKPSPGYVYNRLRPASASCTVPTRVVDALSLLKTEGAVSLADFPSNPANCEAPAQPGAGTGASHARLDDWKAIKREKGGSGQESWESPVSIDDIKGALFKQQPVVFAMPAVEDFEALSGPAIYRHATRENRNWHAMALVGYDEDRQAFRLINSWGTQWGDHGYAWISYDTFRLMVGEAYALQGQPANVTAATRRANVTPRQALDDAMVALPCGAVRWADKGAHGEMTGFAGSEAALDGLHKAMLAVDPDAKWSVDYHPWPQCEAEMTLAAPMAAGAVHVVAEMESGERRSGDPVVLKAGEKFGISADTDAAHPWLAIIYLQSDGSAVALYNGQPAPDAHHRVVANIGTGGPTAVRFAVGPPFGAEMVLALASEQPLFGGELDTYGTERQFLSGLRARLSQATPGSVAAAVLRIRTQD